MSSQDAGKETPAGAHTRRHDALRARIRDRRERAAQIEMLLAQEEDNGGKMIVRFRFFILLLFVIAGWTGRDDLETRLINMSFAGFYLGLNLIHLVGVRILSGAMRHWMSFASVVADLLFLLSVNLYYWHTISPDNFAFALKSPLLMFILLPLMMTILQFRRRLIFFAFASVLVTYLALIGYGFSVSMPVGTGWYDHVLGKGAYVPSLLIGLPIFTIVLAMIARNSVIRSVSMLERIGSAEQERQMLSRYFSPDVVQEITANPGTVMRGGRQPVTILFSDIRNFTAMSEGMDPGDLANLLSNLRRLQIDSVFAHSGTVDKFIGDAIMATFGTPHPSPSPSTDALNAVRTGWEMLTQLARFNEERNSSALPPIKVGIGIHSGEAFAGNIGDEEYLEYTVIGDVVNTASRIESLCKPLGSVFLISEECYELTQDHVVVAKKPLVKVKGKEHAVQVYEVIGII
ncbi:MAG: adenylate/guanylate cyclase domain-containing protein [Spirochaetia bacterium]|nr:adenylate/guanylate cyclase domain-containing protein [Spirochaetia bacterium]